MTGEIRTHASDGILEVTIDRPKANAIDLVASRKLNDIFALVEQMQGVDTTGVEPLSHPIAVLQTDLSMRLRDDVVSESNHREAYQKPAPATQDGLYLVPKVID